MSEEDSQGVEDSSDGWAVFGWTVSSDVSEELEDWSVVGGVFEFAEDVAGLSIEVVGVCFGFSFVGVVGGW